MNAGIVSSNNPILLVGGAPEPDHLLQDLLTNAGLVVAADGGADWLLRLGHTPDVVIGDLDSLSDASRAALPADRIYHIAEQDSTDFDKCLRNITAPLIIGVGFLGARVDHMLAALTVLVRHPNKRCLLVGADDVIAHLPPTLDLDLREGDRVSLYPLAPVSGRSTGLNWPIDGLTLSPDNRVGTSNRATGPVHLKMNNPGMLIILPASDRACLSAALLRSDGSWPVP